MTRRDPKQRLFIAFVVVTATTFCGLAHAEEAPTAQLRLQPWREAASEPSHADRYRYLLEVVPQAGSSIELVADHRLLELEVRTTKRRRAYRCNHPDAPRRVSTPRIRTVTPGEGDAVWREWVDLRMYCWGKALRALDEGAEVRAYYGFRRRGRERWVVRRAGSRTETRRLTAEPFRMEPAPEPTTENGPLRVTLGAADARSADWLVLRVGVRAREGTPRVYVRNDLWRFRVEGPLGRVDCAFPRDVVNPVVDFFRKLGGRASVNAALDAKAFCGDAFVVSGVYEITPVLDLVYDGQRFGFEALTGTFEGETTPIRIRVGERGYVEQTPDATHERVLPR